MTFRLRCGYLFHPSFLSNWHQKSGLRKANSIKKNNQKFYDPASHHIYIRTSISSFFLRKVQTEKWARLNIYRCGLVSICPLIFEDNSTLADVSGTTSFDRPFTVDTNRRSMQEDPIKSQRMEDKELNDNTNGEIWNDHHKRSLFIPNYGLFRGYCFKLMFCVWYS